MGYRSYKGLKDEADNIYPKISRYGGELNTKYKRNKIKKKYIFFLLSFFFHPIFSTDDVFFILLSPTTKKLKGFKNPNKREIRIDFLI